MQETTLADLRKILRNESAEDFAKMLPIQITNLGQIRWVINDANEVISLTDMHPRMKIQLRAIEKKARAGMPQVVRIDIKGLKETEVEL